MSETAVLVFDYIMIATGGAIIFFGLILFWAKAVPYAIKEIYKIFKIK